MIVDIIETDRGTILINGKELFKDADNNWNCKLQLSEAEINAFNNYTLKGLNVTANDEVRLMRYIAATAIQKNKQ